MFLDLICFLKTPSFLQYNKRLQVEDAYFDTDTCPNLICVTCMTGDVLSLLEVLLQARLGGLGILPIQ